MEQYVDKSIWPGWETLRLLGRGSYGAVYEVRRQVGDLEEHAAVKCLSIPRDPGEIRELRFSGFDEESLSRHFTELKDKIQQEYETMLRLKGSPNIVACEDLRVQQQADGVGWDIAIRMELLTPLMEGMGRTVDEEQVLRLGVDMARALSCCHRKNIVHRDVKPQNIFLDRQGNYKLGDFGVARTMEGTGSATMRTGTYRYMAPEVFNGRHYGPRADLYSLGLVLYWLLNDRRSPFLPGPPHIPRVEDEERARARRFAGEPLPPPTHGSDRLKRIVQKLCAYDPQDRFSSAEELLRVLDNNAGFGIRNAESEKDRRTSAPVGAAVSRPPITDPGPRTNGAVGALHEAPDSTGLELAVSAAGAAVSRPPVASTAQHAPEAAKAEASTPVRRPHPPQAVPLPPARGRQEAHPVTNGTAARMAQPAAERKAAGETAENKTQKQNKPVRRGRALWLGILAAALLLLGAAALLFYPRGPRMTALRELDETGAAALREDWYCLGYYEYSGNKEETEPLRFPVGEGLEGQTVTLSIIEPADAARSLELTVADQSVQAALPESGRVLLQVPASALTDEGWTAWGESLPSGAALTAGQGQAVKESRFRLRETCVSEAESLAGWELLGSVEDEPVYGPWSEWSQEPIEAAPDRQIEEASLYRVRTVERVGSETLLGEDWELLDRDAEYGEWGAWSDWQIVDTSLHGAVSNAPQSVPAKTDTLDVHTKTMYAKQVTSYDWNGESWQPSMFNTLGGHPEWVDQPTWVDGEVIEDRSSDGGLTVYPSKTKTVTSTLTTPAFQTRQRSAAYTYHYVRYGEWSDWTEEPIQESDSLDVEQSNGWRFREIRQLTGNRFARWSDWSDWLRTLPQVEAEEAETEMRVLYRSHS